MKQIKKKKIELITAVFMIVIGLSLTQPALASEKELPKVGERYQSEGSWYYVRGIGDKAFEYVATGESLVIKTPGIPGAMVRVPEKGAKIRIDPSIPMMWVNGKEDKEFKTNTYLKKHAKNKVFLLLEYDRKANRKDP